MSFRKMSTVSMLLIGITALGSANANLPDYYSECTNKYKSMNNSVVYECSGYADQQYKSAMNKAYSKIYKSLKTNGRSLDDAESFEKSQLGWLDYRDQQCNLEGSYIGSPALPFCLQSKNKERAEELISFSENF